MKLVPLECVEEAERTDVERPKLGGVCERNAILLFTPDSILPDGWQEPWIRAGWNVTARPSEACAASTAHGPAPSAGNFAPLAVPKVSARNDIASVTQALGAANDGKPALPGIVGGMLRRSDFLSQLTRIAESDESTISVLMAIQVDQTPGLGAELDRTAAFDLEETICARITKLLSAQDAITIWLEFGFGVLVRRDSAAEIVDLADQICRVIRAEPIIVTEEPMLLSVSVGLALSPSVRSADPAQQWFATAHAAQGIAKRHGGNRHEGVLSREHEPMLAERVLIIREWVEEAKTGTNIIVEFQPLMPASAKAGQIYSVHAKLRDLRAPLNGVYRREYLRLARESGSMVMIDRISLFNAFETLEQERRAGRRTRLIVPAVIESLCGLAWRWFVEELRRRPHLRTRLIIELEVDSALLEKDNLMRIVRLRRFGVGVCLCGRSEDLAEVSAWSKLPGDFLRVSYAALNAACDADIQALAENLHSRERELIVTSVTDTASVRRLAGLGVDYLRGQALAATGPRPDYEFFPAD
ncbi:MAG: EAL domain-containing protein [Dokdonella sp.]